MKKLILLLLFIPLVSFAQVQVSGQTPTYRNPNPQPIKVEVTTPPSYAPKVNQTLLNNTGSANNRSKSESYEKIATDLLIGNSSKYERVIISKVTGWAVKTNRQSIFNELESAGEYLIVNPENPKRNYKVVPEDFLSSPKSLFLEWHREMQGYDRISNLKLKDFNGVIIFEGSYKNKSYSEMLRPLMSVYNFTKEMALKKIKEYKELKDLEVITQEEYNQLVKELRPILLSN